MRKLTVNAIGGKDVSPRQVADGQGVIREIRVFPPLAHTFTKKHNATTLIREGRGDEASSPDITASAVADTLPPEGFLEVKNWFADLKKDWRRPAR